MISPLMAPMRLNHLRYFLHAAPVRLGKLSFAGLGGLGKLSLAPAGGGLHPGFGMLPGLGLTGGLVALEGYVAISLSF